MKKHIALLSIFLALPGSLLAQFEWDDESCTRWHKP